MKVIIPLAGKGTRLRPHTHLVPKPMLKIAGKPVMAYILEDLEKLGGVDQVVYVTGHLKEKVEQYARTQFSLPAVFVEQTVQDGTAGAVKLAQPYVDQDVLIIFVDTIFETDLSVIKTTDADGIIWVKEVEDYQRFGVVVTDKDGNMTKIVEKPSTPISKRAQRPRQAQLAHDEVRPGVARARQRRDHVARRDRELARPDRDDEQRQHEHREDDRRAGRPHVHACGDRVAAEAHDAPGTRVPTPTLTAPRSSAGARAR
jgi:GTP:adenosylcobinamide-phosphate guanylyltransferase